MLKLSLGLEERINVKRQGIAGEGGGTIAKVLQYDLHIMKSFKPQIVVLEPATNDLSHYFAPATVGSSLEDLTQVLHSHYAAQRVVVCQTLFRDKNQDFNEKVTLLNKYSSVVISSLPYTYFWKQRSLWNSLKTLPSVRSNCTIV